MSPRRLPKSGEKMVTSVWALVVLQLKVYFKSRPNLAKNFSADTGLINTIFKLFRLKV